MPYSNLQTALAWRSFLEHDLPLVTTINADIRQVAIEHRRLRSRAAQRLGLTEIPCLVRELSDDEAFMELVLGNAQGELSPLELGVHVLQAISNGQRGRGKKGGIRAYATQVGKDQSYLTQLRLAAEVFLRAAGEKEGLTPHFLDKAQHLAAIHKAPPDTWAALATQLLAAGWSVEDTEAAVKRVNELLASIPA